MEQLGKITEWRDDRGFGFITPMEGEKKPVFFHVRDYQQRGRRPEKGELVKYAAAQKEGRLRATSVRRAIASRKPVEARTTRTASSRNARAWRIPAAVQYVVVMLYLAALGWAIAKQRLPIEFAFVVLVMSTITWMAYALDKHAAQRGRWRTPETTLHLLELLCGWPGALLAQQLLRHKTRKPDYRVAFWCMVILNYFAIWYWVTRVASS